jgi:hypothetical protein
MCGKDNSPSPFIPLYSTVAVDKAAEANPTQAESDIELAKSRYCDAATRTSPTSIFDIDCPLVMTRQENEFRLAMVEKMRQASYRGIEAEFKMPFFNTRMAVDSEETGEVSEAAKVDDAIKVVNVSQVKPATNEELGLKFESHNAEPSESADIQDAEHPYVDETLYFTPEGQNDEPPTDYRWKTLQLHDFPCPWGGTKPPPMPPVESEAMPDKEGPVAREEDVLELLLALERRFNRLSGNVKAYNEKIADLISDVEMLKIDSPTLTGKLYEHDSALALLGKELADLRKAGEAKPSGARVEGGNPPTGVFSVGGKSFRADEIPNPKIERLEPKLKFSIGHEWPISPPSSPAGQKQSEENLTVGTPGAVADPSKIHPHRFIAHNDTVIDTARCGDFTASNPTYTADMLNLGKYWSSGSCRRFPKVTERHRIFNERAAVIAQESIPLCRAVEYIILGNEMYDSVSFDLNSYLKGDGKFLKPLDRAQSICIAIDWLRVELNRLRHERWREEEARIAAGME